VRCPALVPGVGTGAGTEPWVPSPRAETAELSRGNQPQGTGMPSLCSNLGAQQSKSLYLEDAISVAVWLPHNLFFALLTEKKKI